MLMSKKIAIIGSGNIGEALLGGLVKAKLTKAENITATDIFENRLQTIKQKWDTKISSDNAKAVKSADIIVLCVKPQVIQQVLQEIKPAVKTEHLVISILAGINTHTIQAALNKKNPIVRAMPNIPVVVDEGATGICLGPYANDMDKQLAVQIFESVGTVEIVPESHMDVITGMSGSGPAYIYMVIEALTDGGVMMGLPRDVATRLATQTVLGSAKLVKETDIHPAVLKDQVTTPGGTAISAVKELETHGLRPMLIRAVETASKKSKQLSQLLAEENMINKNDRSKS